MYVGNAPPPSITTPITAAQISAADAQMIPMGQALANAMQWPCFAPSPAFDPATYGPAVVADSAQMQQLATQTAATSAAMTASPANVSTSQEGSNPAPSVVPLDPYDIVQALPSQSPKTQRSCPAGTSRSYSPQWGASMTPSARGLFGAKSTPLFLAALAALGLYGLSEAMK